MTIANFRIFEASRFEQFEDCVTARVSTGLRHGSFANPGPFVAYFV